VDEHIKLQVSSLSQIEHLENKERNTRLLFQLVFDN